MERVAQLGQFVITQSAQRRQPVVTPPSRRLIDCRPPPLVLALGGKDGKQLENLHLHDPAEQLIRCGYLFST